MLQRRLERVHWNSFMHRLAMVASIREYVRLRLRLQLSHKLWQMNWRWQPFSFLWQYSR